MTKDQLQDYQKYCINYIPGAHGDTSDTGTWVRKDNYITKRNCRSDV